MYDEDALNALETEYAAVAATASPATDANCAQAAASATSAAAAIAAEAAVAAAAADADAGMGGEDNHRGEGSVLCESEDVDRAEESAEDPFDDIFGDDIVVAPLAGDQDNDNGDASGSAAATTQTQGQGPLQPARVPAAGIRCWAVPVSLKN